MFSHANLQSSTSLRGGEQLKTCNANGLIWQDTQVIFSIKSEVSILVYIKKNRWEKYTDNIAQYFAWNKNK